MAGNPPASEISWCFLERKSSFLLSVSPVSQGDGPIFSGEDPKWLFALLAR